MRSWISGWDLVLGNIFDIIISIKSVRISVNRSAKPCPSIILSQVAILPHNSVARPRSPHGKPGSHTPE